MIGADDGISQMPEGMSRDIQITGITAFGLTGRKPGSVYTRSFAPSVNVP